MLHCARTYWGIENKLFWVLDLVFREDESRVRKGDGPQNMAVLRHRALNLLRLEDAAKTNIRAKRKQAGWVNDYLLKVLRAIMRSSRRVPWTVAYQGSSPDCRITGCSRDHPRSLEQPWHLPVECETRHRYASSHR